jgi:hypothetical protein
MGFSHNVNAGMGCPNRVLPVKMVGQHHIDSINLAEAFIVLLVGVDMIDSMLLAEFLSA